MLENKAKTTILLNDEQVVNRMKQLRDRTEELTKKITELQKTGGDSKAVNKLSAQLRAVAQEERKLQQDTASIDQVFKNLAQTCEQDLRDALRKLNKEMTSGSIKRGTSEWDEQLNKIKQVEAELKRVNSEMGKSPSMMNKISDGFNKFGAMAGTAVAAITGIVLALRKLYDLQMEFEENSANLQALTGLNDNDIKWMEDSAKRLATTTTEAGIRITQSAADILDAYTLVGSAKPELLGNKEALEEVTKQTLILAQASKMDLKDAVNGITMAMNQYGANAQEASRYTNVLAAGSKYGAAAVESQTSTILRAGVAAAGANVPIEQLVGTIQTLAEKGIKSEIAGTGLKKFFLVLETGPKETRPSVVGLSKALDTLSTSVNDATQMKKMFGEEGYNTASVLLNNIDKVQQYTKAVTGTNVATEQAAINSKTARAALEQASNQIKVAAIELAESLGPALLKSVNYFKVMMQVLPPIVNFFKEYGRVMLELTSIIVAYTIQYKIQMALEAAHLSLRQFMSLSWGKFVAAIRTAGTAVKAFNAAMMANPYGLVAAGIALLTIGLYKFGKAFMQNSREADTLTKKLDELIKKRKELGISKDVSATSMNEGEKYSSDLRNIESKIQGADPKKMTYIELKALQDDLDLRKKWMDEKEKLAIKEGKITVAPRMKEIAQMKVSNAEKAFLYNQEKHRMNDIIEQKVGFSVKEFNLQNDKMHNLQNILNKKIELAKKNEQAGISVEELSSEERKKAYEAEMDDYEKHTKKIILKTKERYNIGLINKKQYQEAIEGIEMMGYSDRIAIMKKWGVSSLDEENRQADKVIAIYEKITAEKQKNIDTMARAQKAAQSDMDQSIAGQDDAYPADEGMYLAQKHGKTDEGELDQMRSRLSAGLISQQEFNDYELEYFKQKEEEKTKIAQEEQDKRNDAITKGLQITQQAFAAGSKAVEFVIQRETADIEKEYNSRIAMAKGNSEQQARLEEEKESKIKEVKKKYADIELAMKIGEIIASGAVAAMAAWELGPIVGPIAAAIVGGVTILQVATAIQERDNIKNLYTGGYTGPGDWDEPKGIVHAGEFVANRYATRNPHTNRVMMLVNRAQQNNTISSITADDIIDYMMPVASKYNKAVARDTPSINSRPDIPDQKVKENIQPTAPSAVEIRLLYMMDMLNKRLSAPIKADVSYKGKNGIQEMENTVNNIRNIVK